MTLWRDINCLCVLRPVDEISTVSVCVPRSGDGISTVCLCAALWWRDINCFCLLRSCDEISTASVCCALLTRYQPSLSVPRSGDGISTVCLCATLWWRDISCVCVLRPGDEIPTVSVCVLHSGDEISTVSDCVLRSCDEISTVSVCCALVTSYQPFLSVCCALVTRYQLSLCAAPWWRDINLCATSTAIVNSTSGPTHYVTDYRQLYWPPGRWRKCVSPKRCYSPTRPHGVITWKTTTVGCTNMIVYSRMCILSAPHFRPSNRDVSISGWKIYHIFVEICVWHLF